MKVIFKSYICDSEQKWISEYISGKSINYDKYKDPDVESSKNYPFYEDLTVFLNAREEKVGGLNGRYVYHFNRTDPYGIEVREMKTSGDVTGPVFYLKSDQLGFSAPCEERKYPYDRYIRLAEGEEDALKKVAEWIYRTRGIGGSFLWPMEPDVRGGWKENPAINSNRGGSDPFDEKGVYKGGGYDKYWIEDRADLTLFEIKRVLDYISGHGADGILWNCCLPESNLMKWLKHFGSFEKYTEFFCFGPFLCDGDDPVPANIVFSGSVGKLPVNCERDIGNREEKSIFKLNKKELERMFDNISSIVINRSLIMRKVIREYEKNNSQE